MRLVLIFIISLSFAYGDLFNFLKLQKAQELYNKGEYKESAKILEKLNIDNPTYNYDIANAYYKAKEYKKALKYYKRAFGEGVDEANRLHNIGNTYYQLGQFDNAIFAYELSLKIREDENTRFNLLQAQRAKYMPPKKKKKKKHKKKKDRDGKGKKNKKKEQKKLSKKELEEFKKMLKKKKFKQQLKRKLNQVLKAKKVPVLMYKIDTKGSRIYNINPW